MRRLAFITLLLLPLAAVAQVRISGTHYDLPQPVNIDHVVLFADLSQSDAYLEYTGTSSFEWRDLSGNVVQTGTGAETLYPVSDQGYILATPDTTISFYVIDYKLYRITLNELTAEPDCKQTMLTLDAVIPEMSYLDEYLMMHKLTREAEVHYTSLGWSDSEKAWTDSAVVETVRLMPQMLVGAPLKDTYFMLRADQYAAALGIEEDSIASFDMTAIAVDCRPASVTTKRGESTENEVERPIDESQLTGSAPIEINFLSHANKPTATFFLWEIYKGTDLVASRRDEDMRYTFMTNGSYQVKLWVSNDRCTTDSVVFDISISSSQLLVPNVFTPNGDGINDEFRVMYRSLAEFHCWVYNRWGKLVYEWDDPAKGWDGTINGRPAAAGAYYYIIRARGTDADPKITKYHKTTKRRPADIGIYQLSGDINLVR